MRPRRSAVLGLIAGLALLAACGEEKVSSLSYDDLRSATEGKGEAAFRSLFQKIKGTRVAWSGQAVETTTAPGEAAVALLAIDLDGLSGGTTDPDVVFPVPAKFAAKVIPGSQVAFTGVIEDFTWQQGRPLLRLDVTQIR